MSDVERERAVVEEVTEVLGLGFTEQERVREVVAGVLGGVPGEKVTVDRGAALDAEAHVRQWANGDPPLSDPPLTEISTVLDALTAALGGGGGTRPKGTQ